MMSQNLAVPASLTTTFRPGPGTLVLAAGAFALLALFHEEAAAALKVWSTSTAYGHCFLIAPIAAWLAWERRAVLKLLPPRPAVWPGLLILPLIPVWLAADALGIMEGRQLAVIAALQVFTLSALGPKLWWRLSPATLYLFFLVPFGAFLTPTLQRFTAGFVIDGLFLMGIPHDFDGFRITIPEGAFYVAEACAGLRFLIAAVAFGALYAVTMFASPLRRAAFIAVAIVTPILANGIRALGIVLLGHVLGSAQAGAADHLLYGWLFFSTVIIALALAGLPFRQPPAPLPEPDLSLPPTRAGQLRPLLVLAMAALAPATDAALAARTRTAGPPSLPVLSPPAACTPGPVFTQGSSTHRTYQCGIQPVTVTVIAFPPGENPARILELLRRAAAVPLTDEINAEIDRIGGVPYAVLAGDTGAAAYALWFEHKQRVGGLADRVALARAMFAAVPAPTGLVVTSPNGDGALRALLQTAPRFE